jgi:uncharacterized protein YyaL (SSP411 family)
LLLNAYFVPIRVEESRRPDLDLRYTRDGWPTIVFLTPHGEPMLTVNGMETEALIGLLVKLVDLHERTDEVPDVAAPELAQGLAAPDAALLSQVTVNEIVALLVGLEDRTDGGFGGPAKYFYTDALLWYAELEDPRFLEHVQLTLDSLCQRAICDRADGGFFRYSSRSDWNEPHREKLLADQANLLRVALEVFERTRNMAYRQMAEQLLAYLDATPSTLRAPYLAGCQDYVPAADGTGWTAFVDEVVYCDANALTASAYMHAARVLGNQAWQARGLRLVDAVWDTLRAQVDGGGMFHYLDDTGAHVNGLLADSVAVGAALLDAHAVTHSQRYVQAAAQLGHDILRLQLNPAGGFFDISQPGPAALRRPLTALSQNAAAAVFFLRLAEARRDRRLRDAAQWALLAYRGDASLYGAYAASFGRALDRYLSSEP